MQQTASEEAGDDRQREVCDKSKRQRRSARQQVISLDTVKYVVQRSGYVETSTGVVEQEQALKKVALDQGQAGAKAERQPHPKRTCELFSVSCAEAAASKVQLQFGSSLRALLRFSPGPSFTFLPHPPKSLNMRVGPSSPPSSSQHRYINSRHEDEGGRTSGPKRC